MATYTPKNGDTVTVRRTSPGSRPGACTGRIRFNGSRFTNNTDFTIDGCGTHASTNDLRRHGVTQTIHPADTTSRQEGGAT